MLWFNDEWDIKVERDHKQGKKEYKKMKYREIYGKKIVLLNVDGLPVFGSSSSLTFLYSMIAWTWDWWYFKYTIYIT